MKVKLNRIDDAFQFEANDEAGNKMIFDAGENIGGKGNGVRPMQTLLMAMGACSAIDIIMILKKQKQEITGFEIDIEGEREKGKEPALWQKANVVFNISGNVDEAKAKRAVELSMEKYCSVSKTLEAAGANINYKVNINP